MIVTLQLKTGTQKDFAHEIIKYDMIDHDFASFKNKMHKTLGKLPYKKWHEFNL